MCEATENIITDTSCLASHFNLVPEEEGAMSVQAHR